MTNGLQKHWPPAGMQLLLSLEPRLLQAHNKAPSKMEVEMLKAYLEHSCASAPFELFMVSTHTLDSF